MRPLRWMLGRGPEFGDGAECGPESGGFRAEELPVECLRHLAGPAGVGAASRGRAQAQ